MFLFPIALHPVAISTEQLQIVHMISTSLLLRNDVFDFYILLFEMLTTPVAATALFSVQGFLNARRVVQEQRSDVGSLPFVRSRLNILEQSLVGFIPVLGQTYCEVRNINPHPIPLQSICNNQSSNSTTKWIEDNLIFIARHFDNPFQ